jgi:hypothetical protein
MTLLADSFTTLPRRSHAGRIFTARLRVVTADGDTTSRGTVACSLRNARARSQVVVARGFRRGSAFCTWRIARNARGLKLRGSISVRSGGGIIVKHSRAGSSDINEAHGLDVSGPGLSGIRRQPRSSPQGD